MTETLTEAATTGRLDDAALETLFTGAHTINAFAPTPVTDDQLAEIWNLARWAPTAVNVQPLRVVYVQTREARERLVQHLHEGNQAKTLAAPAVALLAVDNGFHEHIPRVAPFRAELRESLAENPPVRDQLGRFNGALQAGYFILAVRAVGLGAGPMGGFDAAGLDAEFFPDGGWTSTLVVNIGHPENDDAWHPRLPRLEHDEVVRWT
ncbi:malonic semialdehyde reductase [Microlunatus sp. GCM10028923]|uniref:malonic semialdehyde reductase n=1 Tax=Microlunatus sp. GCM10028923 TaxID=3273400 RepID=UPI0036167009